MRARRLARRCCEGIAAITSYVRSIRDRTAGGSPQAAPDGLGVSVEGSHRHEPTAIADGGTSNEHIEMVVAIIRPGKLTPVKQALAEAGAPSLTVTNVSGRGSQPNETNEWHGEEYIVDLHQKVKIECAVPAKQREDVVDAIQGAAHTGQPGDGKIFVMPITGACRVSTNERGVAAM